jgi:hypothetical protein
MLSQFGQLNLLLQLRYQTVQSFSGVFRPSHKLLVVDFYLFKEPVSTVRYYLRIRQGYYLILSSAL